MLIAVLKERFQRGLGLLKGIFARPRNLRLALLGGILLLIGLLVAFVNHSPNLAHVRVGVLSGDPQKTYYEIVNALAAEAQQQK
jgi:hypothetical protein